MKKLGIVAMAFACAGVAGAQSLAISIGLRETGFAGGAFTSIGGNGGSTGGIEFVNLDQQQLVLNGTWQQFTFVLSSATINAFAGTSANSILEGNYGVLEMIRIKNVGGGTADPVDIYIDDLANTITPAGGGPTTTTFGDYEAATVGTEVIFQEPNFSGSTSANLVAGGTSLVTNLQAHTGSQSDHVQFEFVDSAITRWVRLTTFNTPNMPNPLVRFDQNSVISFWAMGVPEPGSMIALGLGAAVLLRRRFKK